jgi:hypothetical protein
MKYYWPVWTIVFYWVSKDFIREMILKLQVELST